MATGRAPAGGPVKDALFEVINLETNLSLGNITDGQGVVVLLHLPVGTYRLTVTAQGFKTTVVEDIELHIAIPARVNVTLQPGDPSQEVAVTASETQAVINTTSGELSTLVNRRQILDLPLNGRNPLELSGLQAGVATNTTISQAAINGLRGTYNNVTQDGINIQDNFLRTEGLFGVTAPSGERVGVQHRDAKQRTRIRLRCSASPAGGALGQQRLSRQWILLSSQYCLQCQQLF